MSQNLFDFDFNADALASIDAALTTLEAGLVSLIALTPDQRHELTKMGDKSEAFCRQAGHVFAQNPGVLPGNFDLAGYQRDIAALDALRPRLIRLGKLHQRGVDTEMAIGSDLMTNGLEGYATFKVAGKGQGLDEARKALAARFVRGPSKTTTPPPVPPTA
ncbi:hypothetical protein [Rhodanobacter sp. L36]|uniref:hypothetical protein n=1 Tax=Rhodanobacter sp. L36 TaxID=1747221 RepID=UPI00131B4F70|nr:hypothetical protein [Rhodanobacter sp. L36]